MRWLPEKASNYHMPCQLRNINKYNAQNLDWDILLNLSTPKIKRNYSFFHLKSKHRKCVSRIFISLSFWVGSFRIRSSLVSSRPISRRKQKKNIMKISYIFLIDPNSSNDAVIQCLLHTYLYFKIPQHKFWDKIWRTQNSDLNSKFLFFYYKIEWNIIILYNIELFFIQLFESEQKIHHGTRFLKLALKGTITGTLDLVDK